MSEEQAQNLRLDGIVRTYQQGSTILRVLKGCNLLVESGEIIALVGPSGCGKSTLLHLAGLLERPDAGEVYLNGNLCGSLSDKRRTGLRRSNLGFVYQHHHLLPEFTALENVVMPQMIAGADRTVARLRAQQLLANLNLSERENHQPGQLSGGEQQRVAIARALANGPSILLADEPTGNLDPETAGGVFDQLLELVRDHGLAAVIATHNQQLAARLDRTVRLENGYLRG